MHTWSTFDPEGPEELKAVVTNLVSTSLSHRANSAFKQFGISLHASFCPFPRWISIHAAAVVLRSSQDTDDTCHVSKLLLEKFLVLFFKYINRLQLYRHFLRPMTPCKPNETILWKELYESVQ